MNVAVVGSRNFQDYELLASYIDELPYDITKIISGGAWGADTLAERYATERRITLQVFKPQYWKYQSNPRVAPIERNKLIVAECDILVAFWDGKSHGTYFTINHAKQQGKIVFIVNY